MFKNKQQSPNTKVELSNKEFDKMKVGSLLIDVRDIGEYQVLKKIANTDNELNIINIPYYDLIKNPSTYITDKNMTIITICNAGHRSTAAAISLREQGYPNAYVLINGVYGYYRK
ncbi:rhodanese-like domain-containing protein [Spiroplasma endosymbiont of Virgichneumon dumeticola]|uniref:rhodanese-like domain-containing protein n=1 Tax=Spiroplasma endosymbiont of Virgichneumon dumeticola TaxID=3139323 RepID=UPI0035C8DC1C